MLYYPGVTLEHQLTSFHQQYLERRGWMQSFEQRLPVDLTGPIPWFTYPAIEFLRRAVRPQWKVFEYGLGYSTLWWGAHAQEVQGIDHDLAWLEKLLPSLPSHCHLSHAEPGIAFSDSQRAIYSRFRLDVPADQVSRDIGLNQRAGLQSEQFISYAARVADFPKEYFDIVVVDGMARVFSTWVAVQYAMPSKFIVFDNSDRAEYGTAYDVLARAGYRRIDFWGPGPINPYEWCTSIFLRDLAALP